MAHEDNGRVAYRNYILGLMSLVYLVNFMDRQVLSVLLPGIKADFRLSDSDLGLLAGPAFALFYAFVGVPIAMVGDRFNRRNLVAISVLAFSAMTVFCGYASAYWQLVVGRIGTGVGQAGTAPAVNSMISDLFPKEKRAGALAVFVAGANIGMLFAIFGGGWIAAHYGWRSAFIYAGAPGLLLAALFFLTVREPARGAIDSLPDGKPPRFFEALRVLWRLPAYRNLTLAISIFSLGTYALTIFIPTFLVRSHGLSLPQAGLVAALMFGAFGAVGTTLVGFLTDRMAKRDLNWFAYMPFAIALIHLPCLAIFLLSDNLTLALIAGFIPASVGGATVPATYAAVQGLAPLRMRSLAAACVLFVISIVGLGIGPWLVGVLSDLLNPQFGIHSLRYALMMAPVATTVGAFFYWRTSRTLKTEIGRANR